MCYKFSLFLLVGMQISPKHHELLESLMTALSYHSFPNFIAFGEDQNSVKIRELFPTLHIFEALSVQLSPFPYFALKSLVWNHLRFPEHPFLEVHYNNCVLFVYPLAALQPRKCFFGCQLGEL